MRKKDLTGKRFGKLVVQYEIPERKNSRIYWHCKCDCGNECDVMGTSLTRTKNPTQSCGCLQRQKTREANQSEDLSGQKFGRLLVLHREENSSLWVCKCDCGNIVKVCTNHLNSGHTQSCGCLQKERTSEASFKNLVGQRFGLLTVLKLNVEKSTPKLKIYTCKCDCGSIKDYRRNNLISGDSQSCGCLRISHGELKIQQLLQEYNISFVKEKTFETCRNPKTNKNLRFDFYVNDQYLIEYNGKQHYNPQEGWGRESIEELQFRDQFKQQWAKDNNIPLLIIPYTKYNTLTIDDLLLPDASFDDDVADE